MRIAHILAVCLTLPLVSAGGSLAQDMSYLTAPNEMSAENELTVRGIVARLNHALDAADYQLYSSFFSEDATFISDFGSADGREGVAAAMEQSRPFITDKRHVTANFVVSGDDERAVVTTYLVVFERAAGLDFLGSSVNVDTLENREGKWVVVRHDSALDPATKKAIEAAMGNQ